MRENENDLEKGKSSCYKKTIKIVVVKPISEKDRAEIELRRVQKRTELFKAAAPYLAIVSIAFAALTLWLGDRDKKNAAFENAIAQIWSGDIPAKRNALSVALQYDNKHDGFAPRLLDFMYAQEQSVLDSIKPDLISTFLSLGKLVSDRLVKDNHLYSTNGEKRRFEINQWALIELLRMNMTLQISNVKINDVHLDFNNNHIVGLKIDSTMFAGAKISNLSVENGVFSKTDLSGATFRNCTFWYTLFQDTNTFKNVKFEKCRFIGVTFACDIKSTLFSADCEIDESSCVTKAEYKGENTPSALKVGCHNS